MMKMSMWLWSSGAVLVLAGGLVAGGCSAPIHRGPVREVQAATAPDANPAAVVAIGTAASALVEPDLYTRRDATLSVRELASLGMRDQWEPARVPDGRQPRRIWLPTSPETFLYFDQERAMWRTGR